MLGTVVNTCAIIVGTLVGTLLNRGIKDKYKTALYDALGLASLIIGLNAAMVNMPKSRFPVLFILALAVGSVVGTALDIAAGFTVWWSGGPGRKTGGAWPTAFPLQYCFIA